jgi:hypothetical protein
VVKVKTVTACGSRFTASTLFEITETGTLLEIKSNIRAEILDILVL